MQTKEITDLTFDCYGTLIDWERGIVETVIPILRNHGVEAIARDILEVYRDVEALVEMAPYSTYAEVLRRIMEEFGRHFGVPLALSEEHALIDSIGNWPPFKDTVSSLRRLHQSFRLSIVSNVDDELFARTQRCLGIEFDQIITSQQVRSYKPAHGHFEEAIRRLAVPKKSILHVAQSLYHDHVPAKEIGLRTAWIKRTSVLGRNGLAPSAEVAPDITAQSLGELTDLLMSDIFNIAARP